MTITSILFDLDDTLVIEEASADAAFLATCEHAREKHGINPKALHQAVLYRAGELWRANGHKSYLNFSDLDTKNQM